MTANPYSNTFVIGPLEQSSKPITHDSLCYCAPGNPVCGCGDDPDWGFCVSCVCSLIITVREDERDKTLDAAEAAVRTVYAFGDYGEHFVPDEPERVAIHLEEAVAAIRALKEQP